MKKIEMINTEKKIDEINNEQKRLLRKLISLKEEKEKEEKRGAQREKIRTEEEEIKMKLKELEGVEQDEARVRAAEKDILREVKSYRGRLSRLVAIIDNKYRLISLF